MRTGEKRCQQVTVIHFKCRAYSKEKLSTGRDQRNRWHSTSPSQACGNAIEISVELFQSVPAGARVKERFNEFVLLVVTESDAKLVIAVRISFPLGQMIVRRFPLERYRWSSPLSSTASGYLPLAEQ